MSLDYKKIKDFWDSRANNYNENNYSATNLENEKKLQELKIICEKEKISSYIKSISFKNVLDFGTGLGYWSRFFSNYCERILAVDFSEKMIDQAREITLKKNSNNNIEYVVGNVLDFSTNEKFDLIFISGVMIYINDKDIKKIQNNLTRLSKKGTYLLLRDGTGFPDSYQIIDKYSKELSSYYSAIYRTKNDYKKLFENIGFSLLKDENMFEDGSSLNKHKETRLRIYLFQKK